MSTDNEQWDLKICCMGAGYVGGPTMAVVAKMCPKVSHCTHCVVTTEKKTFWTLLECHNISLKIRLWICKRIVGNKSLS